MNTVLKVGAAGALALAGVAAHASIPLPQTGSSDAILFAEVLNAAGTAAVASYAGDTGVSVTTLESKLTAGKTYLAGDANLAKLFAADAAGDSVYFAVLGGEYTGGATTTTFKNPGVANFITTTTGNSTTALANDSAASLVKFAGINGDIGAINSNGITGVSIEGSNPATSGVWDVANVSGLAYWDGGSTANGNVVGSKENLYYVTAGSGGQIGSKVAYVVDGTASLTSSGLTLAPIGSTTTPPVPLPAAVWLLGSGLLGLTGIARRKSKA